MSEPAISVIVPVYNTERYLAEALQSVFAQSLLPCEVIVIDDGSTDGTAEVARSFATRIRYARQENAGSAAARNHGLRLARGELIAFLDADDRFLPHKLASQQRRFRGHSGPQLSVCQVIDFRSPELDVAAADGTTFRARFRPGQVSTWLAHCEVFKTCGLFDESPQQAYAEGSELYVRLREAGVRIEELPELLVERRLHDANKSTERERYLESIARLLKKRIDRKREQS